MKNEIEIHRDLDHPNILKMYDFFNNEERLVIITEIISGGNVFQQLQLKKHFSEDLARTYMKQLLHAVNYMHQKQYVHRDLKPENLLIDGTDGSIKLIDFGISIKLEPGKSLSNRMGTPYYIAPEVINDKYDQKYDIWSCGVILYTMLSGQPPFNAENSLEIMNLIKIGDYKMIGKKWEFISPYVKDLIKKMLQ